MQNTILNYISIFFFILSSTSWWNQRHLIINFGSKLIFLLISAFIVFAKSVTDAPMLTRCVQKVLRFLCFFKNYLFIHEYLFCPLQSNPHHLYTCANVFSKPRSTSKNKFLWSCSAPPSMPSLSPQS